MCVAPEPGPRRIDWLREACGLNAKARAITTPGDKKLENYDETLLNASEATSFRSWMMRLVFVAADIPLRYTCDAHGRWVDSTEDMCAEVFMDTFTGFSPKMRLDTSVNPIFITSFIHQKSTGRASCPVLIKPTPPTNDDIWDDQHRIHEKYFISVFSTLTSETFLSIILWNLIISRSKRAKWHTSRLSIQDSHESLGQTMKQNDQLLNNVRARSIYLHNSEN